MSHTGDGGEPEAQALGRAMSLVGSGAFFRGIGSLVRALAVLGVTIMLVRMLDRSSYGVVALGLAAVGLVAAFTTLGLGPATTRSLAADLAEGDSEATESLIHGLEAWVIGAGLLGVSALVVLVMVTQPQFPVGVRLAVGLGMGGLLFGRNAAVAVEALARGLARMGWMEVPNVLGSVLQFGCTAILFAFGWGTVTAVTFSFGVVGVATTMISAWVASRLFERRRGRRRDYPSAAANLARLAAPYALAGIVGLAAGDIIILVLGLTHSNAAVGSFEPVFRAVGRVLALVPLLFVVAFIPAATTLFALRHRDAYEALYLQVSKLNFVVAFPAVLLLALGPTAILQVVFGTGFAVSPRIVWVILAGGVVDLAFGLNKSALAASGDRRLLVVSSAWALGAAVLLAGILVPLFGVRGAGLATFGSAVAVNTSVSWALFRATGVHPFHRDLVIVVVTAPAALALGFALESALGGETARNAATAAIGSWVAWVMVLRVLCAIRLRDALRLLPQRSSHALERSSATS